MAKCCCWPPACHRPVCCEEQRPHACHRWPRRRWRCLAVALKQGSSRRSPTDNAGRGLTALPHAPAPDGLHPLWVSVLHCSSMGLSVGGAFAALAGCLLAANLLQGRGDVCGALGRGFAHCACLARMQLCALFCKVAAVDIVHTDVVGSGAPRATGGLRSTRGGKDPLRSKGAVSNKFCQGVLCVSGIGSLSQGVVV